MKTKHVVYMAMMGALYATLSLGIAPLSYGVIQFRISEFLKVFCLFNPLTGVGIAIGDIISGSMSPMVSAWELIFMPITDIIGGFAAYYIYKALKERLPVIPMLVYALTTAASVGLMLVAFGVGGFWLMFASVGVSEVIILLTAIPIGFRLKKTLELRQIRVMDFQ